jgi:hypothetical protein
MESIRTDEQIRESQAVKVIEFLDRIDAYQSFKDLKDGLNQNEMVDFEQLEDFLVRINGIARDIPIVERSTDGENVHLEGMGSVSVPEHIDKVPLLKKAYNSLTVLPNKEDSAYLLPLIINAVHLFEDGNGRTSRIMHLLLKEHSSKEEFDNELQNALSINGRFDAPNVSPEFMNMDVDKIMLVNRGMLFGIENRGWDPILPEEINGGWASAQIPKSQAARKFMKLARDDYYLTFVVAYNFLKQNALIEQTTMNFGSQEQSDWLLSPDKMDEILKPEDWENMVGNLHGLKKEKVEIMINAFLEPDKYKTLDGTENLKEGFIRRVDEEYQNNKLLYAKKPTGQ